MTLNTASNLPSAREANSSFEPSQSFHKLNAARDTIYLMLRAPNVGEITLDTLFVCIMEQPEVQDYIFHETHEMSASEYVTQLIRARKAVIAATIQQAFRAWIDGKMSNILRDEA